MPPEALARARARTPSASPAGASGPRSRPCASSASARRGPCPAIAWPTRHRQAGLRDGPARFHRLDLGCRAWERPPAATEARGGEGRAAGLPLARRERRSLSLGRSLPHRPPAHLHRRRPRPRSPSPSEASAPAPSRSAGAGSSATSRSSTGRPRVAPCRSRSSPCGRGPKARPPRLRAVEAAAAAALRGELRLLRDRPPRGSRTCRARASPGPIPSRGSISRIRPCPSRSPSRPSIPSSPSTWPTRACRWRSSTTVCAPEGPKPVEVALAFSMLNAVGYDGKARLGGRASTRASAGT